MKISQCNNLTLKTNPKICNAIDVQVNLLKSHI